MRNIENRYVQYMYSYPHKTAYRRLKGIRLEDYLPELAGRSNSLYFHIPFCQYKCGYCNLFSVAGQSESLMEAYIDAMERHACQLSQKIREMRTRADAPDGKGGAPSAPIEFSQLLLGGGTPLLLPERGLRRVFALAEDYFDYHWERGDTGVETSPNQTTEGKLAILKEYQVDRISIGVQSFQEKELELLGRYHSSDQARQAIHRIKEADFPCVNLDLIYGIPGQTEESLLASLKAALAFAPDELFIYPLYIKKGTELYRRGIVREEKGDFYPLVRDYLKEEGYIPYSMRRFVRRKGKQEGEEGPSQDSCGFGNTLSVGCGGRSYLGRLHFCTEYGVRPSHCLSILRSYLERQDYGIPDYGYVLNEEEEKRRYVIRHILFGRGICRDGYRRHFQREAEEDFPLLAEWVCQGYAVLKDGHISLTEEGFALSDYLGPQLMSREVRQRMEEWREAEG